MRKAQEQKIRKIIRVGDSYCITIPIAIIRLLKWREKQKVVVQEKNGKIVIQDWQKS